MDRIVPFSMKAQGCDIECGHLIVTDLPPRGIGASIQTAAYSQALGRRGCRNWAHHGLVITQRFPAPVRRDEREEAMFDLVPFAGARNAGAGQAGGKRMSAPSAAVNSVRPVRGGSVGRFAEYQSGILRVRSDEAIPAGGVKFLRDSAIILDQPLGVVPAFFGDAMPHGTNRVPRCILSIRFITGATDQINDEIACRLARRDAVATSSLCVLGVSVV